MKERRKAFYLPLAKHCIGFECITIDVHNRQDIFTHHFTYLSSEMTQCNSSGRLLARIEKFLNSHTPSPNLHKGKSSCKLISCSPGIESHSSCPCHTSTNLFSDQYTGLQQHIPMTTGKMNLFCPNCSSSLQSIALTNNTGAHTHTDLESHPVALGSS